jgi:hypothetical protein
MFLLRARFWLGVAKALFLAFVALLALVQLPELRYDLGPRTPVELSEPADLAPGRFPTATFVAVRGTPDFEHAFVYRRYGLDHTYFQLEGYGTRLVVRTYEKVTDEWHELDRFLGRLQPFVRQPFSYHVRDILRDRMGVEIPRDAYFLALDDVPRPSGWQVGAVVFSALLWCLLLYLFFLRRPRAAVTPVTKA